MTKRQRWITAVAFLMSAFPIIIMAFTLKILPNHIPIIDFDSPNDTQYASKYDNLITAVFYLIPLAVVLIARYIKSKMKDFGNYVAIQCVAIVLSLSFATIALYGFLLQIEVTPELETLDFVGLSAVIVSFLIALLGMFVRYRKYNARVAINNKFTRISPSVWKTVHKTAGTVQVVTFVISAMVVAFLKSYYAFLLLGLVFVAYCVWVTIYSYMVKLIFESRRALSDGRTER